MLVASLRMCKFRLTELGVISVYRSQVRAIESLLRSRGVFSFIKENREGEGEEEGISLLMDTDTDAPKDKKCAGVKRGGGRGGGGEEGGGAGPHYSIDEALNQGSPEDRCEISTVDKFQGRDMEMIIFSSVQGKNSEVGNLLIDSKRINVAMTRAKTKFIIIGSVELMKKDSLLANLVDLSIEKNWIINLTSDQILNCYEGI